jgi:hypothetical protein
MKNKTDGWNLQLNWQGPRGYTRSHVLHLRGRFLGNPECGRI